MLLICFQLEINKSVYLGFLSLNLSKIQMCKFEINKICLKAGTHESKTNFQKITTMMLMIKTIYKIFKKT